MPEEHVPYYIAFQTRQETYNYNDYESLPCYKRLQCIQTQDYRRGCSLEY